MVKYAVPFSISYKKAQALIRKSTEKEDKVYYNFIEDILSKNDPITCTREEIELYEYVRQVKKKYLNRGKSIPADIMEYIRCKSDK